MRNTEINENNGCVAGGEVLLTSLCKSLIGYTLGDAVKSVGDMGYAIDSISVSSPPKMNITEYDDSFRVVRAMALKNKSLSILVCKPL